MSRNVILFHWFSLFLLTLQAPAADTKVVVHRLTLKNLHNVSALDQQHIIQEIKSHTYDGGQLNEISGGIGERVRFAFQKRGYFKVEVAEPTITAEKKDGQRELIDVSVVVTEGERYRLKDIGFSSTDVFLADELRRAFPTADGDVFDREKIAFGLDNLRRLYCTKGYVNFSAVPDAQVDGKERRISLRIDLDEGPVFRVGRLTVRGEESQRGAQEKLLTTWKAYEGKIYDCTVLERFLRDLHARASVRPDQVFETSPDAKMQVVNVYIALERPIF